MLNSAQKERATAGTSGAQQNANRRLNDSRSSLIKAMSAAGIPPANPAEIVLDGALHRYAVEGDKSGRRNGWYRAFNDDRPAGAFGSWRTGVSSKWSMEGAQKMSAAERDAMHRRAAEDRQRRANEIATQHNEAAGRAASQWINARRADPNHPYLVAKSIRRHSARQRAGRLVLPLMGFDYRLWSLQFIAADGSKRMLKGGRKAGCMIPVRRRLHDAARVLICEGWATGCTLAETEPESLVLAAIDAGNLRAVVVGARYRWPEMEIVVCADSDDIGVGKAREAAIAAGALLAVPEFPPGAEGSDYNDLAALRAKGGA